jgi:hypothetical protein
MAPSPPPSPPPAPTGRPALADSLPRQALALAAWAGSWTAAEAVLARLGLGPGPRLAVFLAGLAALAGALALGARAWTRRLLVSVKFAVAQGSFLAAAALLGLMARRRPGGPAGWPFHTLAFAALLALLAASALAITWQRRPYPWSRVGFLLTHLAPAVVLAGLLAGALPGGAGAGRALVRAGWVCLLTGCAWMFYLKPVLKRREGRP